MKRGFYWAAWKEGYNEYSLPFLLYSSTAELHPYLYLLITELIKIESH